MIFLLMGLAYQHVGPLPGPTRRSPRDQVGLHGRMGLTRTRSAASSRNTMMCALYGQIQLQLAASLRPLLRSIGRQRVCPLGCKSLDLTWRIARRSPSPSFLNGSSAASSRHREQQGRLQLPQENSTRPVVQRLPSLGPAVARCQSETLARLFVLASALISERSRCSAVMSCMTSMSAR